MYLGAAPGVGKTVAMLDEGNRRKARGTDVVVGVVETHGRPFTAERIDELEVIPRRTFDYRGSQFSEMDIDTLLDRKPTVVLVDELAHTNVPGSRNEKRWQDVAELLDAGVNVITTVNIQHLESLNDIVENITGIRQLETVPDAVVRAADQIQLVDMTPEALRQRLSHGNVYQADKIDAALANYFRAGNLGALRELALLWVADRADEALDEYRKNQEITATWAARTRILVALSGQKGGDVLLRRGAVIAGRGEGRDLVAVHVVSSDGARSTGDSVIDEQRRLADELGASFDVVVGDDPAEAVLEYARSINATLIVVGQSVRGRLSTLVRPSTADVIVRGSGDIDVQVVTYGPDHAVTRSAPTLRWAPMGSGRWLAGLAAGLLLPTVVAWALFLVFPGISLSSMLLLLLLATVICAARFGPYGAVPAALVCVFWADWLLIPPRDLLSVASFANVLTLAVFLVVGGTISYIVARSRALAAVASRRRSEAEALSALTTNVLTRQSDFSRGLLEQVCTAFGLSAAALFSRAERGGASTPIEAVGDPLLTNPRQCDLTVDAGNNLVLGVKGGPIPVESQRLLAAYAAHASSCIARDRIQRQAADSARLRSIESARNTVVTAVLQEFRDPVNRLAHSLERLEGAEAKLSSSERNGLVNARASAERVQALLADLLEANELHANMREPELRSVSVTDIAERAIRNSGHAAKIRLESNDDVPKVTTDPHVLRRILGVLLEGACRRVAAGTRVRVVVTHLRKPNDVVEVRIVDRSVDGTAVRVTPSVSIVFDDDDDVVPPELATGLVKELAEVNGYGVESEVTPGGGLTTILTVPIAAPNSEGAQTK